MILSVRMAKTVTEKFWSDSGYFYHPQAFFQGSCPGIQIISATLMVKRWEVVNCWRWYASARQSRSSITMSYQQLTEGQWYQISALRAQRISVAAMAHSIGVIVPLSIGNCGVTPAKIAISLAAGRSSARCFLADGLSVAWNGTRLVQRWRLSADNGVISTSVPAVICIISIVKWKPSCWLAAIVSWQRGDLRLSSRWKPHYRYREMETKLLAGSDCQLTTRWSAPQ